jgi:hypothetical protein
MTFHKRSILVVSVAADLDREAVGNDRRVAALRPDGRLSHLVRDAMSLTTCSASRPTPGRNPDDIA